MRRTLTALVLVLISIVIAGCAAPSPPQPLMQAAGDEPYGDEPYQGPCIPYGSSDQPSAILDPIYGGTETPTPAGTPLPTCTPQPGMTSTPGPSPTPLATSIVDHGGGPAVRVSSAPQNLTLSPDSENVGRVAVGGGRRAVTWDQSLTLFTGGGAKTMRVSDALGVGTRAGVAISPRGRIHLAGGGRYSYSDDGGVTWADPVAAPAGDDPSLVVGPDGCVRVFWKAGGAVQTAKQRVDSSWSSTTSLGAGGDYDAVRAEETIVALTSSPAVVYRFRGESSQHVAGLGAAGRVDLHYEAGELLAGLVRNGNQAVIARSLDGGSNWSECLVQGVDDSVHDVAVVPTEQGPYAVLWILSDGYFPSVILSKAHWKPGEACGVWPELGQVDALQNAAFVDAPRLFAIGCPQTNFRAAGEGGSLFMAFDCIDDGGSSDVFVAEMATAGFFSGPALGGARAGEEAPRDDYLGDLP